MSDTAAALRRRRRRRTVRRAVVLSALGLTVAVVAVLGVSAARGWEAKSQLEQALPLVDTLQTQLEAGDFTAAAATATQIDTRAARAARLTGDPVWRVLEGTPWAGTNLTAVRSVAEIVHALSVDAIVPLAGVAEAVDAGGLAPADGRVDLDPLVAAQPTVERADRAVRTAVVAVRAIDTAQTASAVTAAVARLGVALGPAAEGISAANRAVQLLPAILGAGEERDYLLLFQNPAEVRATGGIPGALAVLHVDDGRLSLAAQASSTDFPRYPAPVLPLGTETRSIYGDITGQYIQDVTLTPDFPVSATLAREMWRLQYGLEVDGVISIDPVALSYLLAATGPIVLPTGDVLTAENAVQLLLADAYARYPNPADQDAFFAEAAASVFAAVAGGGADPVALVAALARAGDEHRILLWSQRDEEQRRIAETTLAGGLPVSTPDLNNFGVFLNDATGAKMNLYLEVGVAVGQSTCRLDGRPEYRVGVTLTNTAPADAATSLPGYVTGGGGFGIAPGNIRTLVSAYGAPGMRTTGVLRDGAQPEHLPTTHNGYPVSSVFSELRPGESTTLSFSWLGEEKFSGTNVIFMTPIINLPETTFFAVACESDVT